MPDGRKMKIGDPIEVLLHFEHLHADKDEAKITFSMPMSELAKAGLFPVYGQIIFRARFTPESVDPEGDVA